MHCREIMDNASARLSRARSALSLAMKAGPEATKGELLDAIAAAMEHVEAADAVLGEDHTRGGVPGLIAPASDGPTAMVYALPSAIRAN